MMTEDIAAPLRRLIHEVINEGKVEVIDDLMPPDFIEHEVLPPGISQNREGVKQLFAALRQAFPDLEATIEDEIVQGDKVVVRMTCRGSQHGEFFGIPPTGRQVSYLVIDIVRVAEGRIVEHWGLLDQLSILHQLGVMPQPSGAQS
jgi:predicted ester cyclase